MVWQGTRLARIVQVQSTPWRTTALAATAFLLGMIAAGSGTLGAAWEPIARLIRLEDPPRPASANVLSEHEISVLDEMPPQNQAELLLERSINHYRGANDQIAGRVDAWRGHITLNERLNHLFVTAINSDDLTVRVAGVEVDIAARELTKDSSTVDRLEPLARAGEQGPRKRVVGSCLDRQSWRRAGTRAGHPAGLNSRRQRQHSLLGGRGPLVTGGRRRDL